MAPVNIGPGRPAARGRATGRLPVGGLVDVAPDLRSPFRVGGGDLLAHLGEVFALLQQRVRVPLAARLVHEVAAVNVDRAGEPAPGVVTAWITSGPSVSTSLLIAGAEPADQERVPG